MIQNVIIPEKIGHYFIFTQKVLQVQVYAGFVRAVLLKFSGYSVQLVWSRYELLDQGAEQTILHAIKKLLRAAPNYHKIILESAQAQVFVKYMQVPFLEYERIKMVLPFELDQQLPFSVAQAAFDFTIIAQDTQSGTSTILVCAAQHDVVQAEQRVIQEAGHYARQVSFLPLALQYAQLCPANNVCVYIGLTSSWIMYFGDQGHTRFIRKLDFSLLSALQQIAQGDGVPIVDVWQQIVQQESFVQLVDYAEQVGQSVQLSLLAIVQQLRLNQSIDSIHVAGKLFENQGFLQKFQESVDCKVQVSQGNDALYGIVIKNLVKKDIFWQEELLVSAYYMQRDDHPVSLLPEEEYKYTSALFLQQVVLAGVLTVLLLGGFAGYSFIRQQQWADFLLRTEQTMIKDVTRVVPLAAKRLPFGQLVSQVKAMVEKEERLWFSFSQQSEQSLLLYWQELCQVIDRQSLGLQVTRLRLDHDEVQLEGHVKSFEALKIFEQELNELPSLALQKVPRELEFNITLRSKKQEKGLV